MSYNFFQNALDAGKVTQPVQPAYVPSVIKDQSVYSAQNAVQSGITEEEKQYLKSQGFSDTEIMQAGQQQAPAPAPVPEQGFFSGAADKTAEAFMGGVNRIQEAGAGIANDKYTIPEGLIRGVAGAFQGALSPLSGAIGQSVESFVPDSTKQAVGSFVAPAVQSGKEYYNAQSPEQQRNLDNLGVVTEVGANFLGVGGVGKVAGSELAKTAVKETGNVLAKGATVAGKGIAKVGDMVASPFVKNSEADLIKGVGAETADAVIDGVKVSIPKPDSGIVKKAVGVISRTDDPKVLAGRALTPSYAGKTPKQIVNTISDAEKNVNEYWKQVRTGRLQGDLTDLTTSAQSVIDNLDTVGARIGNAVKSAKGDVGVFNPETNIAIGDALASVTAKRSPATVVLQNLVDDLQGGIDIKDGFALKRVYQNEIGKLIRSGDAGTDQFSALVKGVDALSAQIDDLVEKSAGSKAFLQDKKNYALLKKLAGDIAKSAQVEARRSPMTLTEQIGKVRGILGAITNPIDTATNFLAKEVGEMNTRGGAWKALIDQYDNNAIKAAKKVVKPTVSSVITPKPTQIINLPKKPLISRVQEVAKKLDMSKNTKGFINPSAMAEDLGLKAKDSTKALMDEARKYKSGRDMYNNLGPSERRIFDEVGLYSLKHFEDFYKKNILNKKGTTIFRGQTKAGDEITYNDTQFMGNTEGGVFFSNNKDSALKYGKNIIEKITNKSNTVTISESKKLQKMAEQMVAKDIKNGVKSRDIIEQMALGRPKAFSEYTKKPFLETGDMFGEPGEIIYYKQFDK